MNKKNLLKIHDASVSGSFYHMYAYFGEGYKKNLLIFVCISYVAI